MATYYISNLGSDSTGTGSVSSPWATLGKATTTVTTSGDIIHVNAGTYNISSQLLLSVGVSIEGAGTTSIIKSSVGGTTSTLLLSSNSETNGNQHISNIKFDGNTLTAYRAIYVAKRSNVSIYDCTFVDFDDYAISFYGGGSGTAQPTTWSYGNKVYNCTITNCSAWVGTKTGGEGRGAITVDGQEVCDIYNNTITQVGRSGYLNGYLIKGVGGWNKGLKIHDNTLTREVVTSANETLVFDFVIELWHSLGGQEIYGNTITGGSIDISGAAGQVKGTYTYSNWIHDNVIGLSALSNSWITSGILLEESQNDVIVERNYIKNVSGGIWLPMYPHNTTPIFRDVTTTNLVIRYNVFENIGISSGGSTNGSGIAFGSPETDGNGVLASNDILGLQIYNNVIIAATTGASATYRGISIPSQNGGTVSVDIKNNIIINFDSYCIAVATVSSSSIQYNILYGNGVNTPSHTGATVSDNITTAPPFRSSTDYHLSAARNGTHIAEGLSDKDNVAVAYVPTIGAYEYEGVIIPPIVHATSISVAGIGGATTITTGAGGTLQMLATVLPADTTNKTVTWSVANGTGSATISVGGLLTAVTDGTVTVTATSVDVPEISGSGVITISGTIILITHIDARGANNVTNITTRGGTLQLVKDIFPTTATNKNVTWSLTNLTGTATLSVGGLLTALTNGTVGARATAQDGSGQYGEVTITLSNQNILVSSVTVSSVGDATSIVTQYGTLQLSAAVLPANADNKNVTWSMTNGTGTAIINSSGLVAAGTNGNVTARATATDGSGMYDTFVITINVPVVTTKKLAADGWHVPSTAEFETLRAYLGGWNEAGGHLKQRGVIYWEDPNVGADNVSGWTGKGNGYRTPLGQYINLRAIALWHSSDDYQDNVGYGQYLSHSFPWTATWGTVDGDLTKHYGASVRLIKDTSDWTPGEFYTDYDGNVYNTIKIGDQVWLQEDLKVEHFTDGTPIPIITDAIEWAAADTSAMCYYNNIR